MSKRLVEMAAEIVQAQASKSSMSSDEIVNSLKEVFCALAGMKSAESQDVNLDETVPGEMGAAQAGPQLMDPKDSIQENKIVCLECCTEMRQLTAKHLASHGLTPKEYKKKWGFAMKQPLSAKALTRARSKAAKKRGLPQNLMKYQEARKQAKAGETAAAEIPPAEATRAESSARKRTGTGRSRKPEA
jgi:predicted transcriptional regulator